MKRKTGVVARDRAPAPTDADLLRGIATGDLGALGALFDRHHVDVRRFLRRAGGGSTELDDIVQETFLLVPRIAESYDGRPSARPWLLGIATQLLRRRGRHLARFARMLSEAAHLTIGRVRTPEESASDQEQIAALDRALARLSQDKRIVFLLVEGEGLSGEEVAKALDVPVATVWTRLHYVRTDLRRALQRGKKS
jgi:RNA polymerase sigma-70 factor (ECF subfamily)